MVKCRDCQHTDKRYEKKDIRGVTWGRCVIHRRRFKLEKERDCEDFVGVSVHDLFMGEVK